MKKRILSLLLALSMALTLLPMTAFAMPSAREVYVGTDGISGEQQSRIYFGSYPQSSDGGSGYLTEPIEWLVLDNAASCYVPAADVTADNFMDYYTFNGSGYVTPDAYDESASYFTQRTTLLLLSRDILDAKAFMTPGGACVWETASLRSWLNGYGDALENGPNPANPYGDSFIGTAFEALEAGVLADRAFSDSAADKVFLLSKEEAEIPAYGFSADYTRCAVGTDYAASLLTGDYGNAWRLRTTSGGLEGFLVNAMGSIIDWSTNDPTIGVRPAIMIDLDAVHFSTGQNIDHSDPFDLTGPSAGTRSLTVWDGTEGFEAEMADTSLSPSGEATVTVTSLGDEMSYTQISAMLYSEGSIVVCYGSIGDATEGDKTFNIPAGLAPGSYTLRVFAEDTSGDYATTYAGNCVDISVTVGNMTYPVGTRVKLSDGSVWIVVADEGGQGLTLVMDDFLGGTYTRSAAAMALTDFEAAARTAFEDADATVRLLTYDEVQNLGELNPFADQDAGYWLADGEVSGFYQWTYGNSGGLGGVNPEYSDGYMFAVRPVLSVLKSALLAFEPRISEQPIDVDFLTLDGEDAEFSAAATGMSLTYQWQVKEGESFSDIIGADGPTLVIPEGNGLYAEGSTFRCRLYSDWGEFVYTDEAQLKTFDWSQYGEAFAQWGDDFDVSENGNITVHTAAGLGFVASLVNDATDLEGITVSLDRDIDLAGRVFVPIGDSDYEYAFRGHFDGGMHKVGGMTARGIYCGGLFGLAEGALIENLLITDGSVGMIEDNEGFSGDFLGALCGLSVQSTIRNVGVGPVTLSGQEGSNLCIGGIVGVLAGEDIRKCVYNSYSRAVITVGSTDGYVGGIAGCVIGDTIANCYFAGSITGAPSYIGGISAFAEDSELSSCYWLTGSGATCAYYYDDGDDTAPQDTGCTSLDASGLKSAATVTALNAWATAANTSEGSPVYEPWSVQAGVNGGFPSFGTYTPPRPDRDDDDDTPARTITVTETSSPLFGGTPGAVRATADMDNAFSASVEVRLTDTAEDDNSFSLGAGQRAYPFDISLYQRGTGTKVQPKDGYAVTISLPIPEELLAEKEQLKIAHKGADGTVTILASELKQVDGVWYIVFKATEFSPYALVVGGTASYDEAAGLPYFLEGETKTFIGFAAKGRYLAPAGFTVLFMKNAKEFTDTANHWAAPSIAFVTERELFTGTAENVFSPDQKMTRAMFATVLGRLYERSFGKITSPDAVAFTDCDYSLYYGKYVNWATANGILTGYGEGLYGPNDSITREQMAAILYRFAQFMGLPQPDGTAASPFADEAAIPAYALAGAAFSKGAGILTGREDGTFAPKDTATRAEVAASIERLVEYVLK